MAGDNFSRRSSVIPPILSVGLFGVYALSSLFVFLYKVSAGKIFLLLLAAAFVAINLTRKYRLLYAVNLVTVIAFLAFYANGINAFGVLCAAIFLTVTMGVSFLIVKSAERL